MAIFKGVVRLTEQQYIILKAEGKIVIGGQTIVYEPDTTLYITTDDYSGGGLTEIVTDKIIVNEFFATHDDGVYLLSSATGNGIDIIYGSDDSKTALVPNIYPDTKMIMFAHENTKKFQSATATFKNLNIFNGVGLFEVWQSNTDATAYVNSVDDLCSDINTLNASGVEVVTGPINLANFASMFTPYNRRNNKYFLYNVNNLTDFVITNDDTTVATLPVGYNTGNLMFVDFYEIVGKGTYLDFNIFYSGSFMKIVYNNSTKTVDSIKEVDFDSIQDTFDTMQNTLDSLESKSTEMSSDVDSLKKQCEGLIAITTELESGVNNALTQVAGKQDTLESGTNIKTVNGESLLGSGNIVVSGGTGEDKVFYDPIECGLETVPNLGGKQTTINLNDIAAKLYESISTNTIPKEFIFTHTTTDYNVYLKYTLDGTNYAYREISDLNFNNASFKMVVSYSLPTDNLIDIIFTLYNQTSNGEVIITSGRFYAYIDTFYLTGIPLVHNTTNLCALKKYKHSANVTMSYTPSEGDKITLTGTFSVINYVGDNLVTDDMPFSTNTVKNMLHGMGIVNFNGVVKIGDTTYNATSIGTGILGGTDMDLTILYIDNLGESVNVTYGIYNFDENTNGVYTFSAL